MLDVLLYEPEIPPNTGNVIRLAANTGMRLHLIEPLGFVLEDAKLRRAGLDYREWAEVRVHADFETAMAALAPTRLIAFTTRAKRLYTSLEYAPGDALLFGPESRGLPETLLGSIPSPHRLRLPMRAGSRSLNLSNAVAVVVFEAWRQLGFPGGR